MNEQLLAMPQWTTGARLLRLGEEVDFQFSLPAGADASDLTIFPRYLERADPGGVFVAGGDLAWLDDLESEQLALSFAHGKADRSYRPQASGSYLARWRVGDELFHRYFSVIEDDWIVLRFSSYRRFEVKPTLHATGIPLDYRLPIERFDVDDALFQELLDYHRHFGDLVAPVLPDTPSTTSEAQMSTADRVEFYGQMLERVRALLPDKNDARCARIEMYHTHDPGYIAVLARLGVNNHFGLREANADYWLGMPEFPYFGSPLDCRKTNQETGGDVIVNQWDFCGGFHFLGPAESHYQVSEGDFATTLRCLDQCMQEAQNLAVLSGHPAVCMPLYMALPVDDDAAARHRQKLELYGPEFRAKDGPEYELAYMDRYQRELAFEFPKQYKVVYARSLDIADYCRRHFQVTPRTVFVSKTDHLDYDVGWLCTWGDERMAVPRERVPWYTRMSSVFADRKRRPSYKDPLSQEYILVEDQQRQLRFERESPNPIWWFVYTVQDRGSLGSAISYLESPDVNIVRSRWLRADGKVSITLSMQTEARLPDYAIALWGVPAAYSPDRSRIETNARDFILAKNTDGEFHLVLLFDLHPDAELSVTVREQ
ncbi:MAG: hypothetical protein CL878_10515 [Dehalococcoidia bacterium]|nr:hypothetical protein [Dehalococcoidia bacterium]